MKISILGDEGVPVQVDGEAWIQPPGYIRIVHKNRAQTLTRDRVRSAATQSQGSPGHMAHTCSSHRAQLCICLGTPVPYSYNCGHTLAYLEAHLWAHLYIWRYLFTLESTPIRNLHTF